MKHSVKFWNKLAKDLESALRERPRLTAFSVAMMLARSLARLAELRDKKNH